MTRSAKLIETLFLALALASSAAYAAPAAPFRTLSASGAPVESQATTDVDGSFCVRPGPGAECVVEVPMEFAMLPSRQVEAAIYLPQSFKPGSKICVPPENIFVGFCAGGDRLLAVAWTGAAAKATLKRGAGSAVFDSFSVASAERVHIAMFDAPGIWRKAEFAGAPMEKDIALDWRKPFNARWIAQIGDGVLDAPVTYPLEGKPRPKYWRAGLGFFVYPVWFSNDEASIRFCGKALPKDVVIVYAVDGGAKTPFEFLRAKLTPEERRVIMELAPSKDISTLPMPPGPPCGWPAACLGRDRMATSIMRVGVQAREQDFLNEHFLFRAREGRTPEGQNKRYGEFIAKMSTLLDQEAAAIPKSEANNAYIESMRQCLDTLEKRYKVAMKGKTPEENLAHLDEVVASFREAVKTPGPERLAELRYDLSEMNDVLNRLHEVGFACGPPLRKWFQESAFACADKPDAVPTTLKIRQAIREMLSYRHDETVLKPEKDLR